MYFLNLGVKRLSAVPHKPTSVSNVRVLLSWTLFVRTNGRTYSKYTALLFSSMAWIMHGQAFRIHEAVGVRTAVDCSIVWPAPFRCGYITYQQRTDRTSNWCSISWQSDSVGNFDQLKSNERAIPLVDIRLWTGSVRIIIEHRERALSFTTEKWLIF